MIPPRIVNVKALDNFILELEYSTGEKKIYKLVEELSQKPYKKLNNIAYFNLVKAVGPTVQWPDGEDIDPNRLYLNSTLL